MSLQWRLLTRKRTPRCAPPGVKFGLERTIGRRLTNLNASICFSRKETRKELSRPQFRLRIRTKSLAYIYQADIYCDDCGKAIKREITGKDRKPGERFSAHDSETWPQSCGDDEESDCPQHCGNHSTCLNAIEIIETRGKEAPYTRKVGCLVSHSLTSDGVEYIKDKISEGGAVAELWREEFSDYLDGWKPKLTSGRIEHFGKTIQGAVTELLKELQKNIGDDDRASDCDVYDDAACISVTIACSDSLDDWTYQTGDNSFTGSCYHFPYWGVSTLYRDSDCEALAAELIDDMLDSSVRLIMFLRIDNEREKDQ